MVGTAWLPSALLAELDPDAAAGSRRRSARDWLVDVACFVLALGVVAITMGTALDRDVPEPVVLADALAGVAGCVALWWRRRWPVTLAVLLAVAGLFALGTSGAGLVAQFTVAVHRRFAVAAAITGGYAVTTFLYPLTRPEMGTDYWADVGWGLVITAAVLAWGLFVRARRQLLVSLHERARRAETEQQLRVAQARQLERARIAREMHDVLAHRISLLSLHAGALELRPDAPAAEVARAAGVIRHSAHAALQDLREVIGVLREGSGEDAPDRPQPTLADLPGLVDESRQAGMRVRLDRRVADLDAVPDAVGRNVYRIVQEGLTNARKHAHNAAVDVTVAGAAGQGLTVEVRNPWPVGGSPAPRIPGAGTGIVGLAERASLAGGRLEHGRTASGQFRLWAWLPWPGYQGEERGDAESHGRERKAAS